MKFNFSNTRDCHWKIDKNQMAMKSKYYESEYISLRDSMINTSECAFAFDNGKIFLLGVKRCVKFVKGFVGLYRYPDQGYIEDFSRDQLTKLIFTLTVMGEIEYRNKILKALRSRISLKFRLTPDMWLWKWSLIYNSILIGSVHHMVMFIVMTLAALWNGFIFFFCGIRRMEPERYIRVPESLWTTRQKFAKKAFYPAYAFDKFCWQMFIFPDSWFKRALSFWMRLIMCEKSNYVHRMLLGGKVSKQEVDSYKPFLHDRWSSWLISINRFVQKMPDGMFTDNLKDVAMLHRLYKITQCPKTA